MGELAGELVLYPQVLINVKASRGIDWQKNARVQKAKAAVEKRLGSKGRVLLRPSGTEPVLRVMVEGQDRATVTKAASEIAAVVKAEAARLA